MKGYKQGNQICLETLTNNEPFVEYWTVTYGVDFILMGDFVFQLTNYLKYIT